MMRNAFLVGLAFAAAVQQSACMLDTRAHIGSQANPIEPAGSGSIAIGKAGTESSGSSATSGGGGTGAPVSGAGGMPMAALKDNGTECTADAQCKSSNCDGVCCTAGDCCVTNPDCTSTAGGAPAACNEPAQCQGKGGSVECNKEFRCVAKGADNDSACDSKTVANDCGAYLPVYCNGNVEQTAPVCPKSCTTSADCDSDAHCTTTGTPHTCVKDTPVGGSCTVDADCGSSHCANSVCCPEGADCCATAASCPAKYTSAATCTQKTCQGTREMAACTNNECTSVAVQDDSACLKDSVADQCDGFLDVKCAGGASQPEPMCLTQCTNASQCDTDAYCNSTTRGCEGKIDEGQTCANNNACKSGFCATSNKRCCGDTQGECCMLTSQCTGMTTTSTTCTNVNTCAGRMTTTAPECQGTRCVMKPTMTAIPAPAAVCAGMSHTCSTGYKTVACPTLCPTSCNGNDDSVCDTGGGYHCIGNTCRQGCNNSNQCAAMQTCVNNQCQTPPMGGAGG